MEVETRIKMRRKNLLVTNQTRDIFPFGCNGFCWNLSFSFSWLIVMLTFVPETFLSAAALLGLFFSNSMSSLSFELHFDIVQNVFWVSDGLPVVRYISCDVPLFGPEFLFCGFKDWFSSSSPSPLVLSKWKMI